MALKSYSPFQPLNFSHNNTVADNEPAWGDVDKTSLPRNAFADQGEADKKSTWKYPHHWIKGGGNKDENGIYTTGTMYLHKGGLNAAWSAAQGGRSGQEASQAVKSHLNAHRKALGLEDMAAGPLNFNHNSSIDDSEPDWGSINKDELPRQAFADQGHPFKPASWKYPHHWVKDGGKKDDNGTLTTGTLYLHKAGLDAAQKAAKDAPQEVKDHLDAHKKVLGGSDSLRGYSMKAKANEEADILIYEEIGEGWFGGISAKQFAEDIKKLGDLKTITVHMNSPGGNVFDGVTIYNILKQHKARVIMNIDGLAASIASVIAMAGDEIRMAHNAMMMIHDAWGLVIGSSAEMRKTADMLDKVDGTIVGTYSRRTQMDEDKVKNLMHAETWMNAEEALAYGFVDSITDELDLAACFDLSKFGFRRTPAQLSGAGDGMRSKLARMSLTAQKMRSARTAKK